jgi:hypothetical protein
MTCKKFPSFSGQTVKKSTFIFVCTTKPHGSVKVSVGARVPPKTKTKTKTKTNGMFDAKPIRPSFLV